MNKGQASLTVGGADEGEAGDDPEESHCDDETLNSELGTWELPYLCPKAPPCQPIRDQVFRPPQLNVGVAFRPLASGHRCLSG